jgi:hypothetical protein
MADGSVVQGGTFEYTVVAKNKSGTVLVIDDATVALSTEDLGTNSVNPDGSNGVFTSTDGAGNVTLTPKAAGVEGKPFVLEVTEDNVVASVEIVPNPPASVAIVPAA